ncbi:hypothetical protein THAOC_29179, partial [Thalassiosira oceanica]
MSAELQPEFVTSASSDPPAVLLHGADMNGLGRLCAVDIGGPQPLCSISPTHHRGVAGDRFDEVFEGEGHLRFETPSRSQFDR